MFVLGAFFLGCAIGWMRAVRRGGSIADRVQFAIAHGIPAALLGLAALVIGMHLGVGI